jgi:large subunit ribosomal protein L32
MVNHMRHTRAHTANRRSHHALKTPMLAVCTNCGATHRPHHMCLECGFYKGRQVMDLKSQKDKRDARMQAKREAIRAQVASAAAEVTSPATPSEEKK